jgi:hypothetical protein
MNAKTVAKTLAAALLATALLAMPVMGQDVAEPYVPTNAEWCAGMLPPDVDPIAIDFCAVRVDEVFHWPYGAEEAVWLPQGVIDMMRGIADAFVANLEEAGFEVTTEEAE